MADTVFTHIIRYVQEAVGGAQTRAEVQKTAGVVESVTTKTGKFADASKIINTSLKGTSGELIKVKTGFNSAGEQIGQVVTTTSAATGKMNDFERAMRRAAIVAPVWMLLRGAMTAFLQGFSKGFEYMEQFNAALLKAEAVIHGFSGTASEAIGILGKRIRELSQTTGESMTTIAASFYQFGTIGLAFEKSWEGATAVTRFAMATQQDASKIAKTLATTYNLLGHTIDKTVPPTQQIEFELAKLYKLWQLNAGEAEDLTESLRQFLPTANTMDLTLDQTIALLSTLNSAALLGSRGGRLLRTSFAKLAQNLPELASSLGLAIEPGEKLFDTLNRVLNIIGQYKTTGDIRATEEIFAKIFGGVRGAEPIRALTALRDVLKENLEISTTGYSKAIDILKDYYDRIERVRTSIPQQIKLFRELRTQIFESFITGATGAEDFGKAVANINAGMTRLVEVSKTLGEAFHYITEHPIKSLLFLPAMLDASTYQRSKQLAEDYATIFDQDLRQAFAGKLSLGATIKIVAELESGLDLSDVNNKKVLDRLKAVLEQKLKEEGDKATIDLSEILEIQGGITKENLDLYDEIISKIMLQKEELKDILGIERLRQLGLNEEELALVKFSAEINKIVKEYNQLKDAQGNSVKQVTTEQILSLALRGNYSEILKVLEKHGGIRERILDIQKRGNNYELERLKIISEERKQYEDLYLQFAKGNADQQAQIRKLFDLMTLGAGDLAGAFRSNMENKDIILKYWSNFSEEGKKAVLDVIKFQGRLPNIPLDITQNKYYKNALIAATQTYPPLYERPQQAQITVKERELTIPIEINVEGGITNVDIEEIKRKIDEKIKASPNYIGNTKQIVEEIVNDNVQANKLAKGLREKI